MALSAFLSVLHARGETFVIDGTQEGRVYDGHGAVSAGASSRLLIDYPEPQRSEILDYLFKPNYGAALQHLKVEIGGDVNSTAGCEPSHMHTRFDTNYNRGYQWWLMKEAKARNPDIILDCLAWGAPGWIGSGNYWSQDMADYVVNFIKGAKQVHDLDIEYTGVRNEVLNNTNWIITLRNTLDANGLADVRIVAGDEWNGGWQIVDALNLNAAVSNAVYAVGAHYRSKIDNDSPANAKTLNQKLWGSEEGIGGPTWPKAQQLAQLYNRNYIVGKMTKNEIWSPITSYYDILPAPGSGLMVADSPWSGAYSVSPAIWATAHTTQFAFPGWTYLEGGGNGFLAGGGSYVSLKSPNNFDYSIVIETTGAAAAQNVTFQLAGGLSTGTVRVWRSTATASLVQVGNIVPAGGQFTLSLAANNIYTLTTTTGQGKGSTISPAASAFPLPYLDDFESEPIDAMPRYLSDQSGIFEVVERADGQGQALRQVTTQAGIKWAAQFSPYTILGEEDWRDYEVSTEVLVETSGTAYLYGRIADIPGFSDPVPRGYWLKVETSGTWELVAHTNVLASGSVTFPVNEWHRLRLAFRGSNVKAWINGELVADVQNTAYSSGLAGIGCGRHGAQFDNFFVGLRHRGGANLALDATASASSVYQNNPAYAADKANDDNTSTRWNSNTGSGSWLKLDFGVPTVFNQTHITQYSDRIAEFKIQAWTGSTWQDLVVSTDPLGAERSDHFMPVTSTSVRLFVTSATTTPSISEFAVFHDPPVTNLALSGTASASSFWQNDPTYAADKANDDNLGTRWNAHATNVVDSWLALDFGAPTVFNKTITRQYADRVTSYEIQYWTGSDWATAHAGGQMGETQVDVFAPVTASKARLYVTGATTTPTFWEFEVYRDAALAQSVVINEWMTHNTGVVPDPKDGQYPSWFELFNPGNQTADLEGWFLTGDLENRFRYAIPAGYALPPGGYLLVWADNQPAQNIPFNGDLHVNFQLGDSSIIGLFSPDGAQMDLVDLFAETAGRSYGSRVDGDERILETAVPTPRTSNTRILARSITIPAPAGMPWISFSGLPSLSHRIQANTNLVDGPWLDVAERVANPFGDFSVNDTSASNAPVRFYRAVSP